MTIDWYKFVRCKRLIERSPIVLHQTFSQRRLKVLWYRTLREMVWTPQVELLLGFDFYQWPYV